MVLALHESASGTELPIRHVRSYGEFRGLSRQRADFPKMAILTPKRSPPQDFAAAHNGHLNPIPLATKSCCNALSLSVVRSLGWAMRRRDFIKGIAGSAIARPLAVRAEQSSNKVFVVGILWHA